MEIRLYAGRPAPDGEPAPPVTGRPHVFRHASRAYWLLAACAPQPPHAMNVCLFHADRRTTHWHDAGWPDTPVNDVTYELWNCNALLVPVAPLVRASDTALTAARGFVDRLPHRSLATAVSTYAAAALALTGRAPRRVTTLTRITQEGERLTARQGVPA